MAGREYYTPLRYPGGKGKFSHFIKEIIEKNDLLEGHYVEPYAGGAGVALELLCMEYVSHIHINDVDPAVYSFWLSVIYHSEELCKLIESTPVTIDNWLHQKKVISCPSEYSLVELGYATFFLNRVNRSGILKAGVIGGKAQSGKWKLDVRFNKSDLIKRINKIASYKDRISVYNLDAIELLTSVVPTLPEKCLIYLDPPYYVNGSGLYRNFYQHKDHVEICEVLAKVERPWIVSYDNVLEIKEIYKSYRQDQYFLTYTAQIKKKGSEVMIYGPNIICPNIDRIAS
ncbi:DNA adenine methylase [Yersinia similis]|uniref:Site-specific DNA methylase n=1 Tax=Yersinia similis TaxID=367190 RepID=A0A0T9PSN5_9GAMM|nr:DNA adenine methylase [Yersinia similis]CNG45357.1 Site-specific DNA methylase [Yersinia similis]CNH79692.1 Site-specific DNA methylase [Yersinia similis]